jgi:pimeloyl-ACP methyl ester carboxylesterase
MKLLDRGHVVASAKRIPFKPTALVVVTPKRTTPFLGFSGLWSVGDQWTLAPSALDRSMVSCPLRGHEKHAIHSLNHVSLMDYVLDAEERLKANGPSILMGQSAGGYVVQILANRNPELVKGVVLFASSMPKAPGVRAVRFQAKFLWYSWYLMTGFEFCLRPAQYRFVQGRTKVLLGRESGRAAADVLGRKIPVEPILHCPVYSITGNMDQFADVGRQKLLADYHHADFEVIFGDHMFHCDKEVAPRAFRLVRDWCFKHQI